MLRTVDKAKCSPVSLDEAKAHLRRDDGDDDVLIKALILAATEHAQNMVQRRFIKQTVEWVLHDWHGGCIELPIAPVVPDGVLSIEYAQLADGLVQTLDPSLYVPQTRGHTVRIIRARGVTWPLLNRYTPEPVVIRFEVGDELEDVAPNVKAAILLILAHLYENRANVVVDASRVQAIELPQGAEALLMAELWS